MFSVHFDEVIDFVQFTKSGRKLIIAASSGYVEIIYLKSQKRKRLKTKCDKRNRNSRLALRRKELLYTIGEDTIGILSIKEGKEERKKLPFSDINISEIYKIKKRHKNEKTGKIEETHKIILRGIDTIWIVDASNELTLSEKITVKGEITALTVTNKYLVYAASEETVISIIKLSSFQLFKQYTKDFEVYSIIVEDENVIAAGVNVFAIYDLLSSPCNFSLRLWDLEASNISNTRIKKVDNVPTLRQICSSSIKVLDSQRMRINGRSVT